MQKLKSIAKIIFYNILFLIIVLILIEIIATILHLYKIVQFDGHKYFSNVFEYKYLSFNEFRLPSLVENAPKHNIILAGCSYTYGEYLPKDKTFSAVLSNYTHSNVYNMGISGGSPREMLYILRNNKIFYRLVDSKKNIDYFIYTFIDDHPNRLYYCNRPNVPFYVATENYSKLKYLEIPENLNCANFGSYLNSFLANNNFYKNISKLTALYIKEIKKEVKKKYPNIKFIVLVYDSINPNVIKNLDDNEIEIYKAEDLVKDIGSLKYRTSESDRHPNAEAWKVLVPVLSEKLNL